MKKTILIITATLSIAIFLFLAVNQNNFNALAATGTYPIQNTDISVSESDGFKLYGISYETYGKPKLSEFGEDMLEILTEFLFSPFWLIILSFGTGIIILNLNGVKKFLAFLTPIFWSLIASLLLFYSCSDMGCGLGLILAGANLIIALLATSFFLSTYLYLRKKFSNNKTVSAVSWTFSVFIFIFFAVYFFIKMTTCSFDGGARCLTNHAVKKQDPSLCEKSRNEFIRDECHMNYMRIKDELKNTDSCNKIIQTSYYKDKCFYEVAQRTEDSKICNFINSSLKRENCESLINN